MSFLPLLFSLSVYGSFSSMAAAAVYFAWSRLNVNGNGGQDKKRQSSLHIKSTLIELKATTLSLSLSIILSLSLSLFISLSLSLYLTLSHIESLAVVLYQHMYLGRKNIFKHSSVIVSIKAFCYHYLRHHYHHNVHPKFCIVIFPNQKAAHCDPPHFEFCQ